MTSKGSCEFGPGPNHFFKAKTAENRQAKHNINHNRNDIRDD